ncbi:hypothetical protein BHM03_00018494 [Ensete ventricosum]|nr:hypothetical protein BHM03_00018494 [Ensete ventricosum]
MDPDELVRGRDRASRGHVWVAHPRKPPVRRLDLPDPAGGGTAVVAQRGHSRRRLRREDEEDNDEDGREGLRMRGVEKAREDGDIMDTRGENELFVVLQNHGNPNPSGELIRVYGELSQRQVGLIVAVGISKADTATTKGVELVETKNPLELVGTERPLELVETEILLETDKIESPLEMVGTESSLELIRTESPLELVGIENSLELVWTKRSLEIVRTESSLELVGTKAHWR